MSNLSERQRKILQFIVGFVSDNEFPPTIREIGEQVGISSTSVVNYNLAKLEELGLISRRKEVSRGLSLNWDRLQELTPALATLSDLQNPPMPLHKHNGNSHESIMPSMMRVPVLGAIAAGLPIQVEATLPKPPMIGWNCPTASSRHAAHSLRCASREIRWSMPASSTAMWLSCANKKQPTMAKWLPHGLRATKRRPSSISTEKVAMFVCNQPIPPMRRLYVLPTKCASMVGWSMSSARSTINC